MPRAVKSFSRDVICAVSTEVKVFIYSARDVVIAKDHVVGEMRDAKRARSAGMACGWTITVGIPASIELHSRTAAGHIMDIVVFHDEVRASALKAEASVVARGLESTESDVVHRRDDWIKPPPDRPFRALIDGLGFRRVSCRQS